MTTLLRTGVWVGTLVLVLLGAAGAPPVQGAVPETVVISEFMAANTSTLRDQDGDYSDWIELCNLGSATVDLANWSLTDSANNLAKWRFPSTPIAPGQFLVVFASGKNRRVSGRELHTSFKLDAPGEYLALVKPDGATRASEFAPAFPTQAAGISYGAPLQTSWRALVGPASPARVHVPADGALGDLWAQPEFDDSGWMRATNGAGFEQDSLQPFTSALLGDSVSDFSGTQGSRQWFYGYWDKSADPDGAYDAFNDFRAFPRAAGPFSAENFWNGSSWNWFAGDPPYTQLTSTGGHPSADNGNPALPTHWVIRRFQCPTNGPVRISGSLSHRGGWVYTTTTGIAPSSVLYVYLTGVGEGYVDDLRLVAGSVAGAGPNLLANSAFDSTLASWTVGTNLTASSIAASPSVSGGGALRMVSSAAGSSRSSSICQDIAPALTTNGTYTLSYWYLPASNSAPLIIRFSGSGLSSTPGTCGDGVVARILVDGAQVYQQSALLQSTAYSVSAQTQLGSLIDFVIDPGPAANDSCDATEFTARIQTDDPNVSDIADSAADWSVSGVQGENSWFYGYYNRTASPGYQASKFTPFPSSPGPASASNYWSGFDWDWFAGNPPWTQIAQTTQHPNGSNNGQEHWSIRRYVSEISGRLTVDWTLARAATCGGGVTGRVFHNGVEKDAASLAAADTTGVTRTVVLTNVLAGDSIDFALDPNGPGGADDSCDTTTLTARIRGQATLAPLVRTDLAAAMRNNNASALIRIPFTVEDPSVFQFLKLRMRYDDGFVAFLNGVGVAARNSPVFPDAVLWNSAATEVRPDTLSAQFESFDLSAWQGLLVPGTNILAIHGLNVSAADADFLAEAELSAATVGFDPGSPRYFVTPTPGAVNGYGNTNLGPIITDVSHSPAVPLDAEDLRIVARVTPSFQPVDSVKLTYRVMFNLETTAAMFDDGLHGDGAANDGVWGASIPTSLSTPGQMIRYYVTATDTRTVTSREPLYADPLDSPQYYGTMVAMPALDTNALPVIHWFIDPALQAAADTDTGARCAVFYYGELYDNVAINLHGQSSRGFPKKSYDLNFNRGAHFQYALGQPRVDAINFISTYADKAHMRNVLAYDTYAEAGARGHWCYAARVQQNGAFWGTVHIMENGDNEWLQRLDLDPNGALYKMYNVFTALGDTTIGINGAYAEKKTRKTEGNADLVALYNGAVAQSGAARTQYLFDAVDVPAMVNFLAARLVTGDIDCCHKNYYLYFDSDHTRLWQAMPWDVDLSFGRVWSCATPCLTYWDAILHPETGLYIGGNNGLFGAILNTPAIRQMYQRRVRTLMDQWIQAPGTPTNQLRLEARIDQLARALAPDAALDLARWGTWGEGAANSSCCVQSLAQAVADLKTNYLARRRAYMFTNLTVLGGSDLPLNQPADALVLFGPTDYNPASHNQAHEFLSLTNPNAYAVDISGWAVTGAVQMVFRGGTVIPPATVLYLTPDINGFRSRVLAPKGGQGLFVLGDYQGQLSAWGETLVLTDPAGRAVATNTYPGTPSLAQQFLRITEVMYHPAPPPAGSPYSADDFEYIELKNISPSSPVDLGGVHFTNGLEFAFAAGAGLAPGESLVVVRNPAAFVSRYGASPRIGGQYAGALDNGGERLRLDDVWGEKILDFTYNNSWSPLTDGLGFSLTVLDENAPWYSWDQPASWRPSARDAGSPCAVEPAPVASPVVLITEVLTASIPPATDAVELYNPGADPADIGHWYLTDDFNTPKKFSVPAGTVIPAGGYLVFTEADFNSGGPAPNFAFSSKGDEAFLFAADDSGLLTGYWQGWSFGAAEPGVAFGRYGTSTGEFHFVAQSSNTLASANALPKVGPVVIREIQYHPASNAVQYVALQNITGDPVALFDPVRPTNVWQFSGAGAVLPTNLVLAAGASLYVSTADPAAFRNTFLLPPDALVAGPMTGALQNNGEKLELSRPGVPELVGGRETIPYIAVDTVRYSNEAPWPTNADGLGPALARIVLSAYGNDPTNWATASLLPLPVITQQPQSTNVFAGVSVTFRVAARGSNTLSYQWRFNGAEIPGATSAAWTVAGVQASNAGVYSVVVRDAVGPAESAPAVLMVLVKPTPYLHPLNLIGQVGGSVTFTSAASGTLPMGARWRKNSGSFKDYVTLQSNVATLTLTNLYLTNAAAYSAVFTNYGAPSPTLQQASSNGMLAVVQPPVGSVVSPGAPASLRAIVNGTLPRYFAWEFNGAAVLRGTNVGGTVPSTNVLAFPSLQPADAGIYTFCLTNIGLVTTTNAGVITTNWFAAGPPAEFSALLDLDIPAAPPVIVEPPTNRVVAPGAAAGFSVRADGLPPLSYQWFFSSTNLLPGATNSWISIPAAGDADVGAYHVVVSNPAGNTPSASALLLLTTTDRDGDQSPDWAELLAGTDPLDPQSCLRVEIAPDGAQGVLLHFEALSNRTYSIQFRRDVDGVTTELTRLEAAPTNRQVTVPDTTAGATQRIYRIATPAP